MTLEAFIMTDFFRGFGATFIALVFSLAIAWNKKEQEKGLAAVDCNFGVDWMVAAIAAIPALLALQLVTLEATPIPLSSLEAAISKDGKIDKADVGQLLTPQSTIVVIGSRDLERALKRNGPLNKEALESLKPSEQVKYLSVRAGLLAIVLLFVLYVVTGWERRAFQYWRQGKKPNWERINDAGNDSPAWKLNLENIQSRPLLWQWLGGVGVPLTIGAASLAAVFVVTPS
jgi:hypothetical protein